MDNGKQLHVLFLPYFAIGHIIPLVNAARLFASRGVKVTILTTHHNASLFRSSIDNDDSHSIISTHTLRFPSAEVGLPEGFENFSFASSPEISSKIFYAIFLLQKPMADKIREIRPDCILSDMYFPWTVDIALELNIPRLLFNQSSYMYNSILHNLKLYKPHKKIIKLLESQSSSSTNFLVPGLPDKIEFKLSQLTEDLIKPEDERIEYDELVDQIRDSEDRSYGIVHDTFYELEPAYADYYQKMKKTKCWQIGPISHFSSKLIRRKELINAADESNLCAVMEWLNEQKHKSVLYVSFGSVVRFPEEQLTEIAKALEASSVPFIWVMRKDQSAQTTWLPDGFEEKGQIIRGWAPQVTILDHSAIGGFLTHCGWNSVLEAIVAAVPLLTWPVFADQFYNEKLVEVMGLGVKVGAEICNLEGVVILSPVLGSEKIKEGIVRLMRGSKESQNIREKIMAMSNIAKDAVEEGGSSWNNLTALIDDIKNFTSSSMTTMD